jgi:hypothetical protein
VPEIVLPANNWVPRDYQRAAWMNWQNGGKRQLLFWHRRAGKDEINLHMHAVGSAQRVGTYWHMLPLATQARKAIWTAVNPHSGRRRLFDAFPDEYIENMNDNEMFIRFKSGSTFQVVGSDNFNSLVGSPPIGITFSEWALSNPSSWAYLSPILAENGGWASFITTPRGNNHAKGMYDVVKDKPDWFTQVLKASDTGAISIGAIEEQREIYVGMFGKDIADALIDQEFYCSFTGAMVGAYFGAEMSRAERDGRIKEVAIDPTRPVHTAWDLGKATNNPIWCFQVIGGRLRVVDFYVPESDDLEEWCAWLNAKGYHGNDYVPHDILVTEWGSKRTRIETLRALGRKPKRVTKVSVADGLQAGRIAINAAEFDAVRCEKGIEGLKAYRREWDDERKTFRENPVKDWAEHIGSAWRYLGLAWKEEGVMIPDKAPPPDVAYTAMPDGSVRSNVSVRQQIDAMIKRKRGNG